MTTFGRNHSIGFIFWFCWLQIANGANKTDHSGHILSRQRRYLIFPSGSSIQFITDIDIYVPGWDAPMPITGISVAMAWGLPNKPTYPGDSLMHLYEEGHSPLLEKRKDANATGNASSEGWSPSSAPSKTASRIDTRTIVQMMRLFLPGINLPTSDIDPMELDAKMFEALLEYIISFDHNIRRQDSIRLWNTSTANRIIPNNGNQFSNATRSRIGNNAFKRYLAETYFRPWIESASNERQSGSKMTKTPPFKPKLNKSHSIYPPIGQRRKRSPDTTRLEKFYLDHHRNTRFDLYETIEKYLFAKGYNGTACVLKTLCEVGKKRSDSEPGTFLAELVRVIFSLPPAQSNRVIDRRHVDFDEAHGNTDDCNKIFYQCPSSVWEAESMMEYYD